MAWQRLYQIQVSVEDYDHHMPTLTSSIDISSDFEIASLSLSALSTT